MESSESPSPKSQPNTPATASPSHAVRAGKFIVIGLILTVFNFGLYTAIVRWVFQNNDYLWLATLISTAVTTILAYLLHSRITWKERSPGQSGVIKFFIWNIILAVIISPALTWLFGLITPFYQFAFGISEAIHLPFDYDFIQSTGAFGLTTAVTMVLNYFCYDRFVFGKK